MHKIGAFQGIDSGEIQSPFGYPMTMKNKSA